MQLKQKLIDLMKSTDKTIVELQPRIINTIATLIRAIDIENSKPIAKDIITVYATTAVVTAQRL